jgi:hypothetical protein
MRTYLELVNDVLIAIRDDTVTSVSYNPYSALIASFVNDAKQQVEDAHNWSANLVELQVSALAAAADPDKVSLVGSNNAIKIDYAMNLTNNGGLLIQRSRRFMQIEGLRNNIAAGVVSNWCNNGVDANGDAVIQISPAPSADTTLVVVGWQRKPDLVDGSDVLVIPARPVRDLAVALAVRERGEVQGNTSQEYFQIAKRTLSDAIAYDSARNDEESDWKAEPILGGSYRR